MKLRGEQQCVRSKRLHNVWQCAGKGEAVLLIMIIFNSVRLFLYLDYSKAFIHLYKVCIIIIISTDYLYYFHYLLSSFLCKDLSWETLQSIKQQCWAENFLMTEVLHFKIKDSRFIGANNSDQNIISYNRFTSYRWCSKPRRFENPCQKPCCQYFIRH